MTGVRVLLADDQPLSRHGLAMILQAQGDIEVVGQAADGVEAVQLAAALRPAIVLMDVRMPRLDGIAATRQIIARALPTRVIVLTTFDLDDYAFEALRAGASGFLLKNSKPDDLTAAIRAVAAGDAVIAPSTTRRLLDAYADRFTAPSDPPAAALERPASLESLTRREREVFDQMVSGLTNKEIAQQLALSETTVKTHVVRILAKLALRDRVQAVIYAYETGYIH
jgi:DNA-binding NarL/FixJ family response regulator